VAYHAKPFRNPHSICVSIEALCTALIVIPALRWGSLFSSLPSFELGSCILSGS